MTWIFRSIKFNVILFACIAFLAALGTLLPQVTDNAEKVSMFLGHHPYIGDLFNAWGFFDIYRTLLFSGLLGLMAFDVVLCKLWNRPPDPGLAPSHQLEADDEVSLKTLRKKPFRLERVLSGSVRDVAKNLSRDLKKHHYALKRIPLSGGGVALLGARHRVQRWGSYISHISIVVILLGAMIKSLFGFETFLPVLEGHSANVTESLFDTMRENQDPGIMHWPQRLHNTLQRMSLDPIAHWTLWVDKLTVDFYRNSTTPSTFASQVRLYDDIRALASTTIRVNQPLDVHHVRFYQASWGVTGMIRGAILRVGEKTVALGMKESFPVPGEPWTARVEHYLPDFTIAQNGGPTTASLEWKNPALILGFYNKKQVQIGTLALGAPSPITPPDAEPWGMFFFAGGHLPVRPPFQVLSVQPILFSGVQVSYDPGFPLIVGGVLFMLLGLYALFYLHQRRVLIFIRPHGDSGKEIRIEAGGWSSRGEHEFENEFKSLFRSLAG